MAAEPGAAVPALVIKPKVIDAARAALLIRSLFPDVRVREEERTGSVVVFGSRARLESVRATFDALDTKGPSTAVGQAFPLRVADPRALAATLRKVYPHARVVAGPGRSLIVVAPAQQLAEITTIVQAVDVPPTPAPSAPPPATGAVTVNAAAPLDVARVVGGVVPNVRTRAAGQSVVVSGPPDAVDRAKQLVAQLDIPAPNVRYSQIYRLRYVDAASVAGLVTRTFPDVKVDVDQQLNAFTAVATTAQHQRIADGVAQLDVASGARFAPPGPSVAQPGEVPAAIAAPNGQTIEVVTLRAAQPGVANQASTSSTDIGTAVQQTLQNLAPDLHVTVPANNPSQLILAGAPDSIALAKQLIAQLDVSQKIVVLDTEIYEVDQSASKNLGFSLGSNPVISTTYTEATPAPLNGVYPPLQGLQSLARTPLSFTAQLNLLVQKGDGRVLADPRIATVSGRTATIRAGENISILTTTGGASGTVATTQIQTFQTGVTLDITPVINAGNYITVSLHPVVNSLSGTNSAGIPQISTRDTQTTVAMQSDQTLVIGGLIEDDYTRSDTKIPVLGDLPLIGKVFRDSQVQSRRNELIITVTPHVLNPGETNHVVPQATLGIPGIQALPTLPPAATLPSPHAGGLFRRARPTPAPPQGARTVVPLGTMTPAPAAASPAAVSAAGMPTGLPTPRATPSAFAQSNIFTYGSAPQNNFAAPGDPVKIYYATFGPTVLKNNTTVNVSAITSSNVSRVTVGYQGFTTQLSTTGAAGQWDATYTFTTLGLPFGQSNVPLTLTATRADGTTASITIPVSVAQ